MDRYPDDFYTEGKTNGYVDVWNDAAALYRSISAYELQIPAYLKLRRQEHMTHIDAAAAAGLSPEVATTALYIYEQDRETDIEDAKTIHANFMNELQMAADMDIDFKKQAYCMLHMKQIPKEEIQAILGIKDITEYEIYRKSKDD